jgi:hypothetical protein
VKPIQVLAVSLVTACLSFAAANVPVRGEVAPKGVAAAKPGERAWFAGLGDGEAQHARLEKDFSASLD